MKLRRPCVNLFAIRAYPVLPIDPPQYLLYLQGIGTGSRARVQEQIQDQVSTLWSELASLTEEPERPLEALRGDEAGAEESTEAAVPTPKTREVQVCGLTKLEGKMAEQIQVYSE